MDASNQLDFGLDSGMDVYGLGSLGYAEHGMDRGLPDFPIQFPRRICTTTVEGNISSICTTTNVFTRPLSYDGPSLRPRPPPNTPTKHPRFHRIGTAKGFPGATQHGYAVDKC